MALTVPDPMAFLLVLARVAGLVLAGPVFGHALVPQRARVLLAVTLAAVIAPGVAPPGVAIDSMWALAAALMVESALGVLLGVVAQFVFAGAELGGQLAGIQMGFGMANLIDPSSHAQVTIVAQWQQLLALLFFLILNVHHLLIGALLESFRTAPPGVAVLTPIGLREVVGLAADLFTVGVRIAAPVVVVLLLTNGTLGVLARTMPQMNVFVVGFPINVGVGLIVLGASLPFTFRLLEMRFGELEPTLAGMVRGLVHG
jgi:flagellar biosynthetic protein FliR